MRTLELCRAHHVRTYLLGNGSNVLFADAGFPGAVVCLTALASQPTLERQPDGRVALKTGAGVTLAAVCRAACAAGLTGLEFAYGIPGTLGGAVYMNAGAYGGEIKDALASAAFLDERLRLQTLPTPALALGYRTSVFETKNWCILEATFLLKPDPQGPAAVQARMEDFMARRRDKQPLDLPSAGSTFKRPQGAFAGQLIDQCGLRGFAVGGAAVSEKHCGFVVNKGGATCADVLALTEEVCRIVKEKTGLHAGTRDPRGRLKRVLGGTLSMNFLVVTGLSGAGKSMAANALEDIGFFCIDNIPAGLLPRLVDFALQGENQLQRVAVVMDIRGLRSRAAAESALQALDEKKMDYDILFLDASDAVIRRRYKETRRLHPMAQNGQLPIDEAIGREREILQPLRERAAISSTRRSFRRRRTASASAACSSTKASAPCRSTSSRSASSTACRRRRTSCSTCAACPTRSMCPSSKS